MAEVTVPIATDATLNTGLTAVANAISHSMLQKDYTELDNKPSINGVTLEGNKTAADLSIDIAVATTTSAGKVKPDGTTITVDTDGTIHGANTVPICDSSDAWNSATNYTTVGQTVIDDNKVWECIQANQNKKPASNASYWKQITLSSLNSSLTNTAELITTINAPTEQTVYNFATSIFNYKEVIFELFFGGIRYSQIQLNTKYIKDFRTGDEANIISLPPYIHSFNYYVEFTFCVLSGTQIKTRDIHMAGWTDLTTFKIYGIK